MATLLLATSMAGCIGEKYLERIVGEDEDDKECYDEECMEKCIEDGGTEEQCRERCAQLEEERGQENSTADSERVGDSEEGEMTQEECEEEGGTWTEAPDRDGEYYCDMGEDDSDGDSGERDRDGEEKCYDENRQEVPCEEE